MRLPRAVLLYAGLTTTFTCAIAARNSPQSPLMADPQNASPAVASASNPLLLTDTMASQRSLSIFASLARDDISTSAQFADKSGYTVVLAPTNSALKAMPHKPWEDVDEVAAMGGHAYKGELGMDRAQRNLVRFVQGCLVRGGVASEEWREGEKRQRGPDGKEVWWEVKNGKQLVMPQGIEVQGVVSRVANGEVWALEGTFDN